MQDKLVDVKYLCEFLGVSVMTLYRWRKEPRMQFPKPLLGPSAGTSLRWLWSDIVTWLRWLEETDALASQLLPDPKYVSDDVDEITEEREPAPIVAMSKVFYPGETPEFHDTQKD